MITVVMSGYSPYPGSPREQYAVKAAESLARYLVATADLRLHIADDGSQTDDWIKEAIARTEDLGWQKGSTSKVVRKGIGGSLNRALVDLDGVWMYTTDDWCLTNHLSLIQAERLLEYGYGYVRLPPTHPDLTCKTRFEVELGYWLQIDPSAGGYAFATRPFLAAVDFFRKVGPFIEKRDAYVTERDYADRIKDLDTQGKLPGLGIAQIGNVDLTGPWYHIGEFEVGTIIP